MKVVIPAGGEGTRLFPYTELLPKALLPVGGKPVIWWIIHRLIGQGFKDFIVCVNEKYVKHFAHEMRDYKANVLIIKNDRPLGSAGEILGVKENLENKPFILHYSDELTPVDIVKMVGFHNVRKGIGTLGVIRNVPLEVGLIVTEGDQVKKLHEKPMLNQKAWAGIAIFEPKIFEYITVGDDFARNVFPKLLNKEKLYCFESDALWLDVGSISHYRRACSLADQGKL